MVRSMLRDWAKGKLTSSQIQEYSYTRELNLSIQWLEGWSWEVGPKDNSMPEWVGKYESSMSQEFRMSQV